MPAPELCFLPATELAARLRQKELSAREVMEAHLAQIERVNPKVNAIVTLVEPEQAMAAAAAADEALAHGDAPGPLHGLPIAHKDLHMTKGMRTTYGSPIFARFIPDQDDLIIERIHAAGAITIGKTNVPEFGAGSQTFNPVFGATTNPYDTTKTCGGSSGGAAVALACGMIPIADGSDLGGSLRNPAGYCNVVGFRPSLGRVARYPALSAYGGLGVQGPMGRTVADAALLLSAIAGYDARDPDSLGENPAPFAGPLERDFRGVRVAWSRDLGGLPIDPRTAAALAPARAALAALGCEVEDGEPDLEGAPEAFQTLRATAMAGGYADLLRSRRADMKDTVIWNVERGLALSAADVARAGALRTGVYHAMRRFFEGFDYLALPVSQVPPFDLATPYPTSINGVRMETYIDWMQSCSSITVTGSPAISVPGGFTEDGLPVGLQLVGRARDDLGVLQLAHAFESATRVGERRPVVAGV
ncbi:MAG: amidase [Tepidiformaceae bacterium]